MRSALSWSAHGIAAGLGLVWLAVTWFRRPTTAQVAYALESRLERRNDESFVTLDDVSQHTLPPGAHGEVMLAALLKRSRESGEGLRGASLVPVRPLVRPVLGAVVAVFASWGLWVAPGYEFPLMARRFLFPHRNLPKPSFVKIDLVPRDVRGGGAPDRPALVGFDEDVVLEARISGRTPKPVAWLLERLGHSPSRCLLAVGDGPDLDFAESANDAGDPAFVTMGRARQDLFVHIRRDVRESFHFQARCGDGQTARKRIEMVVQPKVRNVTLTVQPPQYSQLPERTIGDPQHPDPDQPDKRAPVRLLPGTRAVLRFEADQPDCTASLRIRRADDSRVNAQPEWDAESRQWRYGLTFDEAQADLRVAVVNGRGFACVDPYDLSLVRWDDAQPVVTLSETDGPVEAVAGELVHIPFEASDDLGLSAITVEQLVHDGRRETTVDFPVEWTGEGAREVDMRAPFDLAEIGARPGQRLRLRIRATDTAGNVGVSSEATIQVTSFTRGEDERDRLRALRFVEACLRTVAASPPAGLHAALSAEVRVGILEHGREHDIELPAHFRLSDVLGILETQQYSAPTAGGRRDLRKLYVQIVEVCENEAQAHSDSLEALADSLGALTRFRHNTNLLWRTFGLRYELRRIRAELVELVLHEGEEPPAARVEALQRRLALYRDSLQTADNEWRGLPGVDAAAVAPLLDAFAARVDALSFELAVQRAAEGAKAFDAAVEQRRTEAHKAGNNRGDPKKQDEKALTREDLFETSGRDRRGQRLRSELHRQWARRWERRQVIARHAAHPANELDDALGQLIAIGRGVLPDALGGRNAARRQLDEGYNRLLAEVAARLKPEESAVEPDPPRWLTADARLIGWSPFTPVLPRFRAVASTNAAGEPDKLARLLAPPAQIADAADTERRALAALELEWRADHLGRQLHLGDYERDLDTLIMLLADGGAAGLLAEGERRELERQVAESSPNALRRTAMKRRLPHLLTVEEIPDFMAFCRDVQSRRGGLKREHPHWQPLASIRGAIQRVRHGYAGPPAHRGDTYQALMNITQSGPYHSGPIVLSKVVKAGEATDEEKHMIVDGLNNALRDERFFGRLNPEQEEAIGLSPETMAISRRAKALEVLSDVGLGGVSPQEVVKYNRRVVEAVLPNRIRPAETPPSTEEVQQETERAVELQTRFCRARLGPVRPERLSGLAETAQTLAADLAATAANTAELDPLELDAHTKTLLAIHERVDLFQQQLSVLLGCPGDADPAPDQALLLLELRQRRHAFLNAIGSPLDTIRSLSGADVDAGTLTILAAAVREVAREVAHFADGLRSLGENGQTENPKNEAQVSPPAAGTGDEHAPPRSFALLDEFEFVEQCIERAATATEASTTDIKEFRDDHPRLSTVSLLRGEAALRWSWELLRRAEGLLVQRGRDLAEIPSPNRGGTKYWAHIYGDGYDALLYRTGAVVRELRKDVKNAGDGPFERKVLRALDHAHKRLNDIHSKNRIHYTIYYHPKIIKPRKNEDGTWITERWYFDVRMQILNEDQQVLRDAIHALRDARRAIASSWPRFAGGPRVSAPFRHLARLRSAQVRDQAEYALAIFADNLSAAESAHTATANQPPHTQAWLDWYRRLVHSPLSGSGRLETTRDKEEDETDPNLKFLRREVEKAGRVKTLKNYRNETYKYLERTEDSLERATRK